MYHAHSHIHLFPLASFLSVSRVPTGLNSRSHRHQNPLRITAFRVHVILCVLWHLFYDCLHIKYLNKQNGGLAAARGESHSFPCDGRRRAGRSWVCGGGRQNVRHSEEKCSAWLQSKRPTTGFFSSHTQQRWQQHHQSVTVLAPVARKNSARCGAWISIEHQGKNTPGKKWYKTTAKY